MSDLKNVLAFGLLRWKERDLPVGTISLTTCLSYGSLRYCRFVEKIQRAYRRYRSSRELVALQNLMHALYSEHQKTRRRESIYRPFSGDSLRQLDVSFLGTFAGLFVLSSALLPVCRFFNPQLCRCFRQHWEG